MLIIGEQLSSSHRRVAEAIEKRDADFIQKRALAQVEAGADYLDLNSAVFREKETEYLKWMVKAVREVTPHPLCLDSASPDVLAAVRPLCGDNAFLNSITASRESARATVPLLKKYPSNVGVLCLDDPREAGRSKVELAGEAIRELTSAGIAPGTIYIDPAIRPLGTDPTSGAAALDSLERLRAAYPEVHTLFGLSNISFGLPCRSLLNSAFMSLAMGRGLGAAICDPCDRHMMATITATRLALGQDEYCAGYLKAYRAGKLSE